MAHRVDEIHHYGRHIRIWDFTVWVAILSALWTKPGCQRSMVTTFNYCEIKTISFLFLSSETPRLWYMHVFWEFHANLNHLSVFISVFSPSSLFFPPPPSLFHSGITRWRHRDQNSVVLRPCGISASYIGTAAIFAKNKMRYVEGKRPFTDCEVSDRILPSSFLISSWGHCPNI